MKEFGVPDTVKSISWCGENICIGIRREYMILNATNGALSEVFPSGRIAPPLVVSLTSGELLLGKVIYFIFVANTHEYQGSTSTQSRLKLSVLYMLLDAYGV